MKCVHSRAPVVFYFEAFVNHEPNILYVDYVLKI